MLLCSSPSHVFCMFFFFLTFCGKDTRRGLSLLHRVLTEEPEGGRSSPAAQLVLPFETEQTKYTQQPTQFNEWTEQRDCEWVIYLEIVHFDCNDHATYRIPAARPEVAACVDSASGSGAESIRSGAAALSRQRGPSDAPSCPSVCS